MEGIRKIKLTIRMTPELHEKIEQMAYEEGISVSMFIRKTIHFYLRNRGKTTLDFLEEQDG